MSARKHHPRRLHLGCGLVQPEGWINVDGSWNAWLAKHPFLRAVVGTLGLVPRNQLEVAWGRDTLVHDVRKPLPFASGSITAIYSSHLLEHLYVDEATRLLAECHRVLAPEGVLRVVVPDLRAIVEEYLGGDPLDPLPPIAPLASPADRMIHRLLMRDPALARRLGALPGLHFQYGLPRAQVDVRLRVTHRPLPRRGVRKRRTT